MTPDQPLILGQPPFEKSAPAQTYMLDSSLAISSFSDAGPRRTAPRRPPSMERQAQRQLQIQQLMHSSDLVYISPGPSSRESSTAPEPLPFDKTTKNPKSSLLHSQSATSVEARPAVWMHSVSSAMPVPFDIVGDWTDGNFGSGWLGNGNNSSKFNIDGSLPGNTRDTQQAVHGMWTS